MSPAIKCPDLQVLERLLQGLATPDEAARLESHLLECPSCVDVAKQVDTAVNFDLDTRFVVEQPRDASLEPLVQHFKAMIAKVPAVEADRLSTQAHVEPHSPDFARMEYAGLLRPPIEGDEGIGRLGDYPILRLIGSGGMGFVFLARDPHLKRAVAIKVMRPAFSAEAENRQRFFREAQATAALRNDHVAEVYHVAEDRGLPFLVMPLLEGETLQSRRKRVHRLPLPELLRIGKEAARGLAAATMKSNSCTAT